MERLSIEAIRARPVHWSDLRWMARSPAHYLEALSTPRAMTPMMRQGSLVDAELFGTVDYVVWEGDRRGKAWDAFKHEHGGTLIATREESDHAIAAAARVRRHPASAKALEGARTQVPATWRLFGRTCSTRGIDILSASTLADLKATTDARPHRFSRHAKSMLYPEQLAFYAGAADALGYKPADWKILGVEVKPPYAPTVLTLTMDAMEAARRHVAKLMNELRICEESDMWPAYCESDVALDIDRDDDPLIFGDEGDEAA